MGHYYQYPMYEAICFGAVITAWACIRFFRDDQGRTAAERGVDQLKGSTRRKAFVRFLALAGILNVAMLVVFNIPLQFFTIHANYAPPDITNRSYLTTGFCSRSVPYLCPPGHTQNAQ